MKKILIFVICTFMIGVIGIGIWLGYNYFFKTTHFNIDQKKEIYIHKKDYWELRKTLIDSAKIQDIKIFDDLANQYNYPQKMKTGKYIIEPSDDARSLLRKLQQGLQTPTRVTFNNIRLKSDLAKSISTQLMFSEQELLFILNDSTLCANYDFDTTTIVAMFIPNTYEFYWDVSPEKFVERMNKEYKKFWTKERLEKASKLNLTPLQVSSLAAIVEEECTYFDEYPIVAGLYLNRLKRGQLLQADPTLKYAAGDFTIRRVLNKHKEIDSPYNTYKYTGLPPSPIRIPSIKGIDAVLNPSEHNYLYMCAKEDFSGRHNFTTNLTDHNKNSRLYQAALNKKKIFQ